MFLILKDALAFVFWLELALNIPGPAVTRYFAVRLSSAFGSSGSSKLM